MAVIAPAESAVSLMHRVFVVAVHGTASYPSSQVEQIEHSRSLVAECALYVYAARRPPLWAANLVLQLVSG